MLGFWFCGTSYPTLAVNIPTEGPGVCSMPAFSAPLSRRGDVAFPALKCREFEICQTHQLSSQISDIPPHFRAGQRCGIFWGNHENGENKGICHVASLPSPQLPISQLLTGCHQLEANGPNSCSSDLRIATLRGDCQGKTWNHREWDRREHVWGSIHQQIDLEGGKQTDFCLLINWAVYWRKKFHKGTSSKMQSWRTGRKDTLVCPQVLIPGEGTGGSGTLLVSLVSGFHGYSACFLPSH